MRIATVIDPHASDASEFARACEDIGVASLWVPEVWGYDALTGIGYLAASTTTIGLGTFVVQLGSRSPALLATSALSLADLSDGRFHLGIGVSGPAVMEGFHGVRFDRPIRRTRETIEIIRIASSGERLIHDGEVYPLPLPGSRGRPLRPLVKPRHVPVYIGAMGPTNLRLTGELADGWLANAFIPESAEVFTGPLGEGAARSGRSLDELDLVVPVALEIVADASAARVAKQRHAAGYAYTIGVMGGTGNDGGPNFYNEAFARLGFADATAEVHRLWQAGDREAAGRAVPLDLGAKTNLVGTVEDVAERLDAYRTVGVTTLLCKQEGSAAERLAALSTLLELVARSD